jgi:hypothetical protein
MLSPVGLAATVTASIVLAACGLFQESPVFSIANESGQTLVIVSMRTEDRGFSSVGESELATLENGGRYEEPLGPGQCNNTELVARTVEGADYAPEPHPMCAGDEWIITGPG